MGVGAGYEAGFIDGLVLGMDMRLGLSMKISQGYTYLIMKAKHTIKRGRRKSILWFQT